MPVEQDSSDRPAAEPEQPMPNDGGPGTMKGEELIEPENALPGTVLDVLPERIRGACAGAVVGACGVRWACMSTRSRMTGTRRCSVTPG